MSIIRPPVSGDSPQDSWANQVTEAINKGLLAPSINAAAPAANINLNGISAATIYLYTRTVTATAPAAVDVDILMIIKIYHTLLHHLLELLIGSLVLQALLMEITYG